MELDPRQVPDAGSEWVAESGARHTVLSAGYGVVKTRDSDGTEHVIPYARWIALKARPAPAS